MWDWWLEVTVVGRRPLGGLGIFGGHFLWYLYVTLVLLLGSC